MANGKLLSTKPVIRLYSLSTGNFIFSSNAMPDIYGNRRVAILYWSDYDSTSERAYKGNGVRFTLLILSYSCDTATDIQFGMGKTGARKSTHFVQHIKHRRNLQRRRSRRRRHVGFIIVNLTLAYFHFPCLFHFELNEWKRHRCTNCTSGRQN